MTLTVDIPATFNSAKLAKHMKQLESAEKKYEAGVPITEIFPAYRQKNPPKKTTSIEEQVASSLADIDNSDFEAVNLDSPQARTLFCVKAKMSRSAKKASIK